MKKLIAVFGVMAFGTVATSSHGQDAMRFAPLKMEELTAPQKALADQLSAPPRNNINNPPLIRLSARTPAPPRWPSG